MKRIISLFIVTVFAVAVLSVCTAAMPLPYVYEFDTWKGSGTSSLTINSYGNEFMYIRADEKLGEGDYTVTEDGDNLTVTLSEEYLKTLSADEVGGFYDFTIEMKYAEPKRYDNVEVELFDDSNRACVNFVGEELGKLDKLFYGEEEIDPSHYTFDRGDIVFSADYFYDETGAQRFESGTLFRASFVNDSYTLYSKITFDLSDEEPTEDTTEEPTEVTTEKPTETVPEKSPETGNSPDLAFTVVIVSVLMLGYCLLRTKETV